jgi:hypothetical protein
LSQYVIALSPKLTRQENPLPRKHPSAHSDEQFALFVETMKGGIAGIDQDRFKEMVRDLVRVDLDGPEMEAPETLAVEPLIMQRADPSSAETAAHSDGATAPPVLLPLIGQLVFQWSSSQALLIRLLALMLGTDSPSATMIFSALGTTHLRLDLARRLAMLKIGDRQTRHELGEIIDDFDDAGRERNELVYAMYPVNAQGEVTHTQIMRFVSNDDGRMTFGDTKAIDHHRVADIATACNDLRLIEKALEALMPRLKQEIAAYGLAAGTTNRQDRS